MPHDPLMTTLKAILNLKNSNIYKMLGYLWYWLLLITDTDGVGNYEIIFVIRQSDPGLGKNIYYYYYYYYSGFPRCSSRALLAKRRIRSLQSASLSLFSSIALLSLLSRFGDLSRCLCFSRHVLITPLFGTSDGFGICGFGMSDMGSFGFPNQPGLGGSGFGNCSSAASPLGPVSDLGML